MAPQTELPLNRQQLVESTKLACAWLTERAQLLEEPAESPDTIYHHKQLRWKGTFREYDPELRQWKYYAPCWHTGQTIKALVMMHRLFPNEGYLDSARLGAQFLRDNCLTEGEDKGLMLAFESKPGDQIQTGGMLLSSLGLIYFSEETGEGQWWDIVTGILDWHLRKTYLPGKGHLRTLYYPVPKVFKPFPASHGSSPCAEEGGKPLLNDAIWLRAYHRTGNQRYRQVAIELADSLVKYENPAGNWAIYPPSNLALGFDHGRQAYWWGLPMVMMYEETGDRKYLEVAQRTSQWHMDAQRCDGGQFRNSYHNGKTESFVHETSGAACAAIIWMTMYEHAADPKYIPYIRRALGFCRMMQITRPRDPNLLGALICGVMRPDGTDQVPIRVRDLDAIFYVQATAQLLANEGLAKQVLGE